MTSLSKAKIIWKLKKYILKDISYKFKYSIVLFYNILIKEIKEFRYLESAIVAYVISERPPYRVS